MQTGISQMLKGLILLWYGAIVDIPAGWGLCDGTNGTPDLRDRLVVGAGTTYAPADTGGATTHTHTGTTDGHTHSHDEIVLSYTAGSDRNNVENASNTDTFTTAAGDSLPPYYGLAYIMKL